MNINYDAFGAKEAKARSDKSPTLLKEVLQEIYDHSGDGKCSLERFLWPEESQLPVIRQLEERGFKVEESLKSNIKGTFTISW